MFSILLILFTVGCSKEKRIYCNINIENKIQNYSNTGTYTIYYKNNFVTRIEKKEKYLSENEDVIKYFKDSKELEYYDLKDKYGGVIYDIKSTETSLKTNITFNLNEFDITKFVKDDRFDKDYVVSKKLTLSGIKKFYESKGAICEE